MVEPWYNEGPKDWQNVLAITRFLYIEVLFSEVVRTMCGIMKRGCQCVLLFAIPPPHHNKSCYLYSWYKLPRPIQACHKGAWEVYQSKEGNSTNAEVTCNHSRTSTNGHFLLVDSPYIDSCFNLPTTVSTF